uniref:hypothetical protein n=1 Tax=Oculatella sp. LEGE 06141 TaxID=1828648 RepID=UPI001882ABB2
MGLPHHVVLGGTVLTAIASVSISEDAIALPLEPVNEPLEAAVIDIAQATRIALPTIESDAQRISQATS